MAILASQLFRDPLFPDQIFLKQTSRIYKVLKLTLVGETMQSFPGYFTQNLIGKIGKLLSNLPSLLIFKIQVTKVTLCMCH